MILPAEFTCASCGQINATTVDLSAGRRQQYVEDCQTCCNPNVLSIDIDEGPPPEVYIDAEVES